MPYFQCRMTRWGVERRWAEARGGEPKGADGMVNRCVLGFADRTGGRGYDAFRTAERWRIACDRLHHEQWGEASLRGWGLAGDVGESEDDVEAAADGGFGPDFAAMEFDELVGDGHAEEGHGGGGFHVVGGVA